MSATDTNPESRRANRGPLMDGVLVVAVAAAASFLFCLIFNRESSLSYSIGYNLYGAERILAGEVPYRDFHTLYPPATVYLNAALFRLAGVGLYPALAGVCVFKILTVVAVYGCGRRLMPPIWALAASVYALLWLRPNGPFKAVPMHYGALFLAIGAFFLLKYLGIKRKSNVFLAGLSLGVLVLFKHNIGAYAVFGSVVVILFGEGSLRAIGESIRERISKVIILIVGCAIPVIPVLAYMARLNALRPMLRTLFFGPGEFLVRRLAATPSPVIPLIGAIIIFGLAAAAQKMGSSKAAVGTSILVMLLVLSAAFCIFAPENRFSEAAFYAPVAILLLGLVVWGKAKQLGIEQRAELLTLIVAGGAALMESFPRFAREQAIASGPFIGLLAVYLAFLLRPWVMRAFASRWQTALGLAVLPLVFFFLGARIFFETYFSGFHLKSNTELTIDRGRRVLFPAETAEEIDSVVRYIQDRVPEGGYVFAQSYAGSSYLFLSARKNPSAAQFWGGVGVLAEEKEKTLDALKRENVNLIVSSTADLENEAYQPIRDYITNNFQTTRRFGRVIILERRGPL